MSEMERNRGLLVPLIGRISQSVQDDPSEHGLIEINGTLYKPLFEVERETEANGFAFVRKGDNNIIVFHTLHYNGGASLEEVIESALNKD